MKVSRLSQFRDVPVSVVYEAAERIRGVTRLFVRVFVEEIVGIVTPSIAITQALTLAIVVSVACQSSIIPRVVIHPPCDTLKFVPPLIILPVEFADCTNSSTSVVSVSIPAV